MRLRLGMNVLFSVLAMAATLGSAQMSQAITGGTGTGDQGQKGSNGATALSGEFLKVQSGRYVFYKYIKGNADKPTLVLLPGINRGFPEEYEAVQILIKKGYSILITATSSHWQSLQYLKSNESPFYKSKSDLTSADFYAEVESLLKGLKISNAVMVSLSYSSALAYESDRVRVFTAPLVKSSDSNPAAARQAALWEANLSLNVFLGPSLIRQFRDYGYRTHWSQVVSTNLSADKSAYGANQSKDTVIEGYMSLSRSLEDFDLAKKTFKSGSKNNFILGELESQVRMRGQLEAILNASKKGLTEVIIIRGAEHNVPSSQPVAFVRALEEQLGSSKSAPAALKIGVIDPKKDAQLITWLTSSKIELLIELVKSYDDSTDSADLSSVLGQ